MTKTRLLILGLLIITIFLVVLSIFSAKKPQISQPILPTPTPVAPIFPGFNASTPTPIPTGTTTTIDNVTTNNFYQTSSSIDSQGDRNLLDTGNYRITYLPGFKEFLITITGTGFAANRAAAEQALLTQLGITQQQACQLNIVVQTTSSANPDQAGQTYPLSFCQTSPTPPVLYQTTGGLTFTIGNTGGSSPVGSGSVATLVNAVNQILSCENNGSHAPYPSCVRNLSIPQSFKNNLNATYPNFTCGQFIWSAQGLLGWTSFPGNVGSVYQWYTMNPGHRQNGYTFFCNPYRTNNCSTSKTDASSGAISPGDIILYGSTGRSDPGHIAFVVQSQSDHFTIRVAEANYRHGVTWFRWTNLNDNLGRGANILGWWRKN